MNETITGMAPSDIRHSNRWGEQSVPYRQAFTPSVDIMYFFNKEKGGNVEISVIDSEGDKILSENINSDYGFNIFEWDLKINGKSEYIQKGEYTIQFKSGRSTHEVPFNVK